MFIAIALRDLAPSTLILLRMGSGALALAVYVRLAGHRFSQLRPHAGPLALLALINTAVPFFLIAWGQQYIDSGLAAIFNASAPLFTALFAIPIDRTQRVTGVRLAGVVLAFGGVVLLVGGELNGAERAVAGSLAVIAAGACYGIGGLYAGRRFAGLPASLVAFGSLAWATLYLLPLGAAQASTPGWESTLSVLYLGVIATGIAAVFLDEAVTAVSVAGLALVLTGVALGTGTVRR